MQQDQSTTNNPTLLSTSISSSSSTNITSFPQFLELNADLIEYIISFTADAPLEHNDNNNNNYNNNTAALASLPYCSTLTGALPLVSKQFNRLSKLSIYWNMALERQLEMSSPTNKQLWMDGLARFLSTNDYKAYLQKKILKKISCSELLKQVKQYLMETNQDELEDDDDDHNNDHDVDTATGQETNNNNESNFTSVVDIDQYSKRHVSRFLYKAIYTHHLKLTLPLFLMPYDVTIGEVYGLHLFEPRYRVMIHHIMQEYTANPTQASNGGTIIPIRNAQGMVTVPSFFHFHRPELLSKGRIVSLVQVVYCRVSQHGTADVQLLPIAQATIDTIMVQPSAGNLFFVTATRNGQE